MSEKLKCSNNCSDFRLQISDLRPRDGGRWRSNSLMPQDAALGESYGLATNNTVAVVGIGMLKGDSEI